jgi:predicted RecB family endonuclease
MVPGNDPGCRKWRRETRSAYKNALADLKTMASKCTIMKKAMSARMELARRVLRVPKAGESVPSQDALQLRNWAVSSEDAVLSLEEIAHRIVSREESPSEHGGAGMDASE